DYQDTYLGDYFSMRYSITFRWKVFNSGRNILTNKQKKALYLSQREQFDEGKIQTVYKVKKAYYTAVADYKILDIRRIQLKSAQQIYKMAKKKLELGLATKSDYLQAKVRLENIRYKLQQAEAQFKKSLSQLNSLLGYPLDKRIPLDQNSLQTFETKKPPPFNKILQIAMERPLLKKYIYKLKATELKATEKAMQYTPSVDLSLSFNRDHTSIYTPDFYHTASVVLQWQLFDGLGRYHTYLSAKEEEKYYRYRIQDIKRQIKLNLYQYYLDLETSYKNLKVSKVLLEEAERNFKQSLGEYKVGKKDIISVVSAESSLASARETYVKSLLKIAQTVILLERECGVENLWEGRR
ncbi:MAG: TolC family protein, partial [Aquificae bacterium]|nr:TolC family protein [Aquificota bacterium]